MAQVSNNTLTDLMRDAVASGFDVTITVRRSATGKGSLILPSEWVQKLASQSPPIAEWLDHADEIGKAMQPSK